METHNFYRRNGMKSPNVGVLRCFPAFDEGDEWSLLTLSNDFFDMEELIVVENEWLNAHKGNNECFLGQFEAYFVG